MMNSSGVHRCLGVHAMIGHVHDGLQHGADDGASAPGTGHHEQLSVPEHDRRRHARQHALAWGCQVGRRADEAALIRQARHRVEVTHLVVEQEAGARHHHLIAVPAIERVGQRHGVALGVYDGEVSCIVAGGRPLEGAGR